MSYTTPIKAGTVTLSANSVAVVGSATNWKLAGASAGDMFFDHTSQFSSPIASVESDTALTLEIPYNGTAGSDKGFVIVSRELQNRFGTASKRINELLALLENFGGFAGSTSGLPANSVGEDGEVRFDVVTGTFYDKKNGVWNAGVSIKGEAGPAGADGLAPMFNTLPDCGRFTTLNSGVGPFSATLPFDLGDLFILYNQSTVAKSGQTVHNTSTYGGAARALDANEQALTEKIKSNTVTRRYGAVGNIAKFTRGSGMAANIIHAGVSYQITLVPPSHLQLNMQTIGFYIRAITDNVLVYKNGSAVAHVDDVLVTELNAILIAPSDGWVFVTASLFVEDPHGAFNYVIRPFTIYTKNAGDQFEMFGAMSIPSVCKPSKHIGLLRNPYATY